MAKVLVTGGSGFIGGHVILRLLADGHAVRATVRSLRREAETRATLANNGAPADARIEFVEADLMKDAGWAEAVAGCDYVHHVASPFPAAEPRDPDVLIRPAREGTLRVLRAAKAAGVKRVVLTSSFAAIGYGQPDLPRPFDERDWTNVEAPRVVAYVKSKAIAERAAWDYVRGEGAGLELSVVNPVAVFGPALNDDLSTSVRLIKTMLEGKLPVLPRIYFGAVDVRDVAELHVRAMTHPQATGERFLAVAGESLSMGQIASILRSHLGERAARVAKGEAPDLLIRAVAPFNSLARRASYDLGKRKNATSAKAQATFGWTPIPAEEAIVASAESLYRLNIVR